jgi:riboflavin synthase
MFTGIITDVGRIEAVEERGDLRLRIGCGYDLGDVALGASIACSGVCLTVVDKGDDWFAVDVSAETRSRTASGQWTAGRRLNLERALRVGDELGGHIVTGHVDGIGQIESALPVGGSTRYTIVAGPEIAPYLAAKGSVTIDGVSLTVNEVENLRTVSVSRSTSSRTRPSRPRCRS